MPVVKAKLHDDLRRFNVEQNVTFFDLSDLLKQTFGISGQIRVKYLDEDNDMVSISTNLELEEAFRTAGTPLRLFIFPDAPLNSSQDSKPDLSNILSLFAQQLGLTEGILGNLSQNVGGSLSSSMDLTSSLNQSNPELSNTVLDTLRNCAALQNLIQQQQNLTQNNTNTNDHSSNPTQDSNQASSSTDDRSEEESTFSIPVQNDVNMTFVPPPQQPQADLIVPEKHAFIPLVRGSPIVNSNTSSSSTEIDPDFHGFTFIPSIASSSKLESMSKQEERQPPHHPIELCKLMKEDEPKPEQLSSSVFSEAFPPLEKEKIQLQKTTDASLPPPIHLPSPPLPVTENEFAEELQILAEMGFMDAAKNVCLLRENQRDLGLTIAQLCE